MMKKIFIIALIILSNDLFAAKTETISIFSDAMQKEIKCSVVTPDGVEAGEKLPVVYMLHGHGGNYSTWVTKFNIERLSDLYSVMIVCPDGEVSSWYWDSPIDPKIKYETFVSKELIKHIDANFSTIGGREGRAITGLSMGGHGALYLSMRHPDVFGAAGSMSGGVDIRPFPNSWNMKARLGDIKTHADNWDKYTVMTQLDLIKPNSLALIIDCGTEDFFYEVNEKLHSELLDRKIPHTYITRAGGHNGVYWRVSAWQHFLFFDEFFDLSRGVV